MKKILLWALAAVLLVIIVPVLLKQFRPDAGRQYASVPLDPTRYTEFRFRNAVQDIDLAGMLYLPETEGPWPAAVVIHGSGTSSRSNRWYLSLAHYLQDHGIAVLLPDKRGSEQSGGDWHTASFEDLATDTEAALDYLRTRDDLSLSRIGVIGMSQGGWIAPLVADQPPGVDFLVNVVGSTVNTYQQVRYEEIRNLEQMGVLPGLSNVLAGPSLFVLKNFTQKDFWDAVGDFDPLPYWRRLSIPALALFGAEDTNTPTAESAALLAALDKPNIRVIIYDGSGHALQDPPGRGDHLFRQDALQAVCDFINPP